MNTRALRSKRVVIPTFATVAVLAVGGTIWSATADNEVGGSERERIGNAATKVVGGGTVTDVETSDDPGEAYEVELRREDGTEVDVTLDDELKVVSRDTDDQDDSDDSSDDADDANDDSDDRPLAAAERASAEKAALAAVGGGTVVDVEASDDADQAYEVDVREADGTEWDVDLDSDFTVLGKEADR